MHQRFLRPRGHAWPSPRGGEIVLICSAPEDDDDIDDASIAQYPSKGTVWSLCGGPHGANQALVPPPTKLGG